MGLARTIAALLCSVATASAACTEDAMIVFDGSASMSVPGVGRAAPARIADARLAMHRAIPAVARHRRLGLVVYGPGAAACDSVELRFRPRPRAAPAVLTAIDALAPGGSTPLTEAVRLAARVLEEGAGRGEVVLVTDGQETCGGTPCTLAAGIAARGRVRIHVIGFRVQPEHFDWATGTEQTVTEARCLADATGGRNFSTDTVDGLARAMAEALGCPVIGRAGPGTPPPQGRWAPDAAPGGAAKGTR